MSRAPDIFSDENLRECSPKILLDQIGVGNVAAISGLRFGRIIAGDPEAGRYIVGVTLPVSSGYAVHVVLAGDDTYTVRRMFRGKVKKEWTGVYCEDVGETAYRASCYRD